MHGLLFDKEDETQLLTDDDKCPMCGSSKITVNKTAYANVDYDLKTGKPRYNNFNGKITTRPSNRLLASEFKIQVVGGDNAYWTYTCRKCGWVSKVYAP